MYFERTPGNITDVTTLHNLLKTFKALETKTLHYVMDKGFYSKKNVDELLTSKDNFMLSVPLNNKWVQHAIDDIYEVIHGPEGYQKLDEEIFYVHARLYPWEKDNRCCYLHLYYNTHVRANAVDQLSEKLVGYKKELESEKPIKAHQEAYETFFVLKTTPKRGIQVSYNTQAVNQYINRYAGFQGLLTNSIKSPTKLYRSIETKTSRKSASMS